MKKDSILYLDDDTISLKTFRVNYKDYFEVYITDSIDETLEILKKKRIKVVIIDQVMPRETGLEFIKKNSATFPDVLFIVLTAFSKFNTVQEAIKYKSIYSFILKPYNIKELKAEIEGAIEKYNLLRSKTILTKYLKRQNKQLEELKLQLEVENKYLKEEIKLSKNFSNIITSNKKFQRILKHLEMLAPTDASILVLGETGTGKELIATAIHNLSNRKSQPIVKVNCAALPESLIESELFGHEKGAFTGAINMKKGKFEAANNGTIFLDEIGELPLNIQTKLLRVLQEHEIERIGSNKNIKLNLRVIAATNKNLETEVKEGRFRADLFYRLNVCPVTLLPLRERSEDIEVLTEYFTKKFNLKYNKSLESISKKSLEYLMNYTWPGNVRELENIIERAVILNRGNVLHIDNNLLPKHKLNLHASNIQSLKEVEKNHIISVLKETSGKISGKNGAADILKIKRTTLYSKMKQLGIKKVVNLF